MRICVVDDEKILADNISGLLSQSGHHVITCYHPQDALTSITPDIDLVISDIRMPDMSGFELARHIAAVLGTHPPKTLLMSGDYRKDALNAAPREEVLGVLTKPFTMEKFDEVVALLRDSRNKCPCALKQEIACPNSRHAGEEMNRRQAIEQCYSNHYSECSQYRGDCAEKLRNWILEGKE